MVNPPDSQNDKKAAGFKRNTSKRIAIAVVLITVVVWAFSSIPESDGRGREQGESGETEKAHQTPEDLFVNTIQASTEKVEKTASEGDKTDDAAAIHSVKADTDASQAPIHPSDEVKPAAPNGDDSASEHGLTDDTLDPDEPHATEKETDQGAETDAHEQTLKEQKEQEPSPHAAGSESDHKTLPTGVTFTEATIKPLAFELEERFWGWRPNDILNLTDNVNNFQLGVLEVTRRTVVLLAESISRTGTTDAFDPHLENAMNWLMVRSSRYWFPSPEAKYGESIKEVIAYKDKLMNGQGSFYTRTDNLIPLLSSYENLLGSCDENLVKQQNGDGSKVSLFKADDYFYYSKGVADAMSTILEAVHHDFEKTLENRHAAELLLHALASCRQAAALDPLLITNGDLDGVFANHRANMAAPISHARFYISQLIKTLST